VRALDAETGELISITVSAETCVSGRLLLPLGARACYLLAHGAGAGMEHPAMRAVAAGLASVHIATLRYQFPYMQRGSRRPDAPALCHATVRAAVATATRLVPGLPLFAGGRSFGGRMTSQAQALQPLHAVRGLAFLGFPLHPAGQPSETRAEHLFQVQVPMLFLQGTRDALAEQARLESLVERLGPHATLQLIADADHSFHVPRRSGRSDAEVLEGVLAMLAAWTEHAA
jgi:predicted alpha/beta-hydrolase family hydrolase